MSEFVESLSTAIRASYIKYRGRRIFRKSGGFEVGDNHYDTLQQAKGAVDEFYRTWNRIIKKQNLKTQ